MEEESKNNPNMRRVNIRITNDLHQLYKEESERTGISMSILMYKDMEQMRTQKVMMNTLPEMVRSIKILCEKMGEELPKDFSEIHEIMERNELVE